MSKDPHTEIVHHHHGQSESVPVFGHADTNFESTDAKANFILSSLVIIVLLVGISAAVVVPIHKWLRAANPAGELPSPIAPQRVVPNKPVLEAHPWEDFPDLFADQEKELHSYGKTVAGGTHIPIEQAIATVSTQLPVRANASEGYTVPGGQGRQFSKSLADMPPAYQHQQPQPGPTIQGEIRKNAQK